MVHARHRLLAVAAVVYVVHLVVLLLQINLRLPEGQPREELEKVDKEERACMGTAPPPRAR